MAAVPGTPVWQTLQQGEDCACVHMQLLCAVHHSVGSVSLCVFVCVLYSPRNIVDTCVVH